MVMEYEGERHAQVGGDARRHRQHHGVDRGPRGRWTGVPVLRRAGAGVQAAGPRLAHDAQAVVVVPAVRDHLGDLTRREAQGRAETGGALAGHTIAPAPGPLVAVIDVEPPARRTPRVVPPTVAETAGGASRCGCSTRRSVRSSLGRPGLTARVPGRRIGVTALAEEPGCGPNAANLEPNSRRQEPARYVPVCVLDCPAYGRRLTPASALEVTAMRGYGRFPRIRRRARAPPGRLDRPDRFGRQ
jgi:hypothetical protein